MMLGICRGFIVLSMLFTFHQTATAQPLNGIPVLLYHHVGGITAEEELNISREQFERQIQTLHDAGFKTISLDELLAFMKGEAEVLPDKPIVITFDDGYEDNYSNAFPVLKKYGFKAAIFIVGINIDRRARLSSSNIKEMNRNGITIGSHSMTHPDLTVCDEKRLISEVRYSKKALSDVTGKATEYFAYPGGFYNLASLEAVERIGYQGAFTVLTGLNRPGHDNIYLLRRIPVFQSTDFNKLLSLLNKNQPKTSLLDY